MGEKQLFTGFSTARQAVSGSGHDNIMYLYIKKELYKAFESQ
jgi:hypothetical protein